MPANPFLRMASTQMRVFKDTRTENRWIRFDGSPDGDVVDVMFNGSYAETDTGGVKIEEEHPVAWILESTVSSIDPTRLDDPSIAVNNDDIFVINNIRYRCASCTPDGYGLLKIDLHRERA